MHMHMHAHACMHAPRPSRVARPQVRLRKRGARPQLGDGVVVTKLNDPRHGDTATVVQDDRDAQPFRLRFADGELSMVFYREHQVGRPAAFGLAAALSRKQHTGSPPRSPAADARL